MNVIKRWTAGIASRIDWMVTQVENQEALVTSAIREATQAAARAKVQLGRVREDGGRLRKHLEEQQNAASAWRERARRCAKEDEARALECLRRSRQAKAAAAELERRVIDHDRLEQHLSGDVATIDRRLADLMAKRNLLRSRQSRAEAMSTVRSIETDGLSDLDEIFERWEIRITEREYAGDCRPPADPLAETFTQAEEEAELRGELADLLDPGNEARTGREED